MEIKIDTAKDSKEDIKKVIEILKHFTGDDVAGDGGMFGMFNKSSEPTNSAPVNMFDQNTNSNTEQTSSPMNMFDNNPGQDSQPMNLFDSIPDSTNTKTKDAQGLLDESVNISFDKSDDELDEVRELRDKSETKGDDLRIITYK